jgi:hypothetical protein
MSPPPPGTPSRLSQLSPQRRIQAAYRRKQKLPERM